MCGDDAGSHGAQDLPPLPAGKSAIDVISDYLRLLKDYALTKIKFDAVDVDEVQFCLTVPAIWDNAAVEDMRTAAIQAGLVRTSDTTTGSPFDLIFVREPEAASVFALENVQDPIPL